MSRGWPPSWSRWRATGSTWSANVPVPGLALLPSQDPFLVVELGPAAAARAGAEVAHLPGLGHWWMLQDPAAGAAKLAEFWSRSAK
ncbi:hypothetical protein ABGB18_19335 [Nonomuraea sp. B12E4]|uniref:hypothetical protein n=1 Tax=Nonomuraea sp. B12E4 TaxID=3153564 RepID=UPI00325E2E30